MTLSIRPHFTSKPSVWRKYLLGSAFRLIAPLRRVFDCPLCGYHGPFKRKVTRRYNHVRDHAKCPVCRANERERLQFLVAREVLGDHKELDVLHIAPERVLGCWLRGISRDYVTADLLRQDVDVQCDIQSLPFADGRFDLVFASHVLVYAKDDVRAIAEVRRVLRPGGVAIMPVPILAEKTVDAEGRRFFHDPGMDYPDRFRASFARVEKRFSSEFDERFQLYFYERPLKPVAGQPEPHPESLRVAANQWQDMVPVCFAD